MIASSSAAMCIFRQGSPTMTDSTDNAVVELCTDVSVGVNVFSQIIPQGGKEIVTLCGASATVQRPCMDRAAVQVEVHASLDAVEVPIHGAFSQGDVVEVRDQTIPSDLGTAPQHMRGNGGTFG